MQTLHLVGGNLASKHPELSGDERESGERGKHD
jgi:hypothetical protein